LGEDREGEAEAAADGRDAAGGDHAGSGDGDEEAEDGVEDEGPEGGLFGEGREVQAMSSSVQRSLRRDWEVAMRK